MASAAYRGPTARTDTVRAREFAVEHAGARTLAGMLLLLAGFVILMGIITAEAVYPDTYTTHDNEISDLGATKPPDSVIRQPSAHIFNATMLVSGATIMAAAYLVRRSRTPRRLWISVGLMGIGAFGVGVFPGNRAPMHGLFALLTFGSGGVAAILAGSVISGMFRWASIGLGVVTLGSLFLALLGDVTPIFDRLGDGGIERWVAYPEIAWLIAMGSFLAGGAAGMWAATDTEDRVVEPSRRA